MIKYEILASMKKDKGISWGYLESLIGGYRGKFVDFKKGKTTLTDSEEKKLADELGTTVEYLSGNSERKEKPALTQKDELDIKKRIDNLLFMMSHQKGLMFDGEPLSPEALESVKSAMILGMTAATLRNKEKYNPNKNKKAHTNGRDEDSEKANKKI